MEEVKGNIWDYADQGYIVIPTNGIVKKNGDAVMGAGLAKEAARRFPSLPQKLGIRLKETGNHNYHFMDIKLMTFPTKNHWKEPSDLNLIISSAAQLQNDLKVIQKQGRTIHYFLPRVGCGCGGLDWKVVRAAIAPYLDDPMVTIVYDNN